jgi:HD-GYP domain-containing protein (c-di-GMP phosphodiesterase class II)
VTGAAVPGGPSAIERLIAHIAGAINMRSLYAADHPAVTRHVERLIESVTAACEERRKDSLTFLVVGRDLVLENQPLRKGGLHHEQFIRVLARRGVERLTIARGVDPAECVAFLNPMVMGGVPRSSAHIIVGNVEVRTAGVEPAGAEPLEMPAAEALTSESVDRARDAYTEFRSDRRAGLWRLEEIVWSLMDALSTATREALPLAPLKSHDDYTFVHSVNVSLLNKPGKLEGEEWAIMKSHAEVGALHLAGIEGSYPLAILVAYEHHMRYDGKPNYPLTRVPRKPTLASQMTAISDVFDAICTMRPYHKARARSVALGILRDRVGTFHHPALVANFVRLIGAEEPGAPVTPAGAP